MPNEINIKVRFDTAQGVRSLKALDAESTRTMRAVAASARGAAQATRDYAKAEQMIAEVGLSEARATETATKALLSQTRTREAALRMAASEARQRQIGAQATSAEAKAADADAKAQERLAVASGKSLSAQRRAAVQGENRQHRDEGSVLRQEHRNSETRTDARKELAGNAADAMITGGAVILTGLAAATGEAAKFDSMLIQVRNNTQMTDAEFDAMRAHILTLGKQTGGSMEQMAQAFMRAKNHGFDLAESLKIVDAATKSALATGADINETANVLSQTMHIFHLSADQASAAMNTLHMAQLQGNTTMPEFVANFGLAEAVTSKYGLTLQDTAAITATMTENGLNMAEAGTQIRDVMSHLTNPTKKVREEIEKLSKRTGVDLVGDIKALQSGNGNLTKTMIDLSRATGGQAVEINKIIPAQRGAFGAMALSGKASEDLAHNYGQLGETMSGKLDPATAGFVRQQKTLQAELGRLQNTFTGLSVKVGTTFIPMLDSAAKSVELGVDAFDKLDPAMQRNIVQALAIAGAIAVVGGAVLKTGLGILTLIKTLKDAGIAFGGLGTAAAEAGTAEVGAATGGAAAFATGGAWALAIAGAVALVWSLKGAWDSVTNAQGNAARQKVLDNLAQVQKHRNDGDVDAQVKSNKEAAGNILKSPAYKQVVDAIGPLKAQIADLHKGGVGAFEKGGVSQGVALSEYNYALKYAKDLLAANVATKKKYEADAKALLSDAARMAPDSQTTGVGMQIANAALQRQTKDARSFVHKCQSLARTTVEQVTHAYDGIWDRSPNASAKSNLARFQQAGLAQPYTPGMTLPAGALLYSTTLNKKSGHVQTIGPEGQRLDQYGTNKFPEKSFQWFVRPPAGGRAVAPLPAAGGKVSSFGGDDGKDKAAKDRAQALVAKAGLSVAEAQAAFDHCKKEYERTKNPYFLVLAQAARHKLQTAQMGEAQATLQKALAAKDADKPAAQDDFAKKKLETRTSFGTDMQELGDQLHGTPAERRKRAQADDLERKRNAVFHSDTAITEYERLLDKGAAKEHSPLKEAYHTREKRQEEVTNAEFDARVADKPLEAKQINLERSRALGELQNQLAKDLTALEEKHNAALAKGLDLQMAQLQAQRAVLQIAAAAAKTDSEKIQSAQDLANVDIRIAGIQARIDGLSPDHNTRAMAGINHSVAVQTINAGLDQGTEGTDDAARDRRIQFLRSEIGLTDDLAAKTLMLAEAHRLEAISAEKAGSPDGVTAQQHQAAREDMDLRRERTQRGADKGLAETLLDPKHGGAAQVLNQYAALTTTGTLDQQKQSTQQYLDVLQSLFAVHAVNRKEALADIDRLTKTLQATGTLNDAQIAKIVIEVRGAIAKSPSQGPKSSSTAGDVQGFMDSLSQGAGQASGDFVHELLHGKGTKGAMKAFWEDLTSAAEGGVQQAISGAVSRASQGMLQQAVRPVSDAISSVFKSVNADTLATAAAVYGLYNISQKKGKHKTGAIIGGILGAAAGVVLGGGVAGGEAGFGIGSALGGQFATGGRPPVGKMSIVGEKGWEPFIPDVPGRILSHADAMTAMQTPLPVPVPGAPRLVLAHGGEAGGGPALHQSLKALSDRIADMDGGSEVNIYGGVHNQGDVNRVKKIVARDNEKDARGLTP